MIEFKFGEYWKPIEGFESMYEVSNMGKIGSWQGRGVAEMSDSMKILKPTPKKSTGALRVFLTNPEGKVETKYVHRLVAFHFIEKPKDKDLVLHKDFDYRNNKASNLYWGDRSDLMARIDMPSGEDHPNNKLTGYEVREIREKYGGESHSKKKHHEIAEKYNVCRQTIGLILQGKIWNKDKFYNKSND